MPVASAHRRPVARGNQMISFTSVHACYSIVAHLAQVRPYFVSSRSTGRTTILGIPKISVKDVNGLSLCLRVCSQACLVSVNEPSSLHFRLMTENMPDSRRRFLICHGLSFDDTRFELHPVPSNYRTEHVSIRVWRHTPPHCAAQRRVRTKPTLFRFSFLIHAYASRRRSVSLLSFSHNMPNAGYAAF